MANWFPLRYALLVLSWVAAASGGPWAQFRGPNGSGVDSGAGYPVEFSPSKNVVWKTAVPYGQSSAIVVGSPVQYGITRQYQVFAERSDKLLFIKAAPSRKYSEVVEAMDIARGAGVQVIGFTPADQAQEGQ